MIARMEKTKMEVGRLGGCGGYCDNKKKDVGPDRAGGRIC